MHCRQVSLLGILAIALTSALPLPVHGADPSPFEWNDIPRVVAIGDVHGSYDKLLQLLRGTDLVDDGLSWTGGTDHLVLVGDMVDRGPDDRQVLDLVMRLQKEAAAAGGQVHALLGNHEVMNLSADLRYVSEKGFRDFADEDDKKARNRAMQRFRNTHAPGVPLTSLKPAFEEEYPPGYFGRMNAFWRDGVYGSWLLEQPAIIKINGVLFLHGGLTDVVAAKGLEGINREVHESIRGFMENGEALFDMAGFPPSYGDAIRTARDLKSGSGRGNKAAVANTVLRLSDSLPYTPSGPLWYRGVSNQSERFERYSVERSLEDLDARAMVVAHTPTASGRINSRFGGTVFRVDVGMAYGREPLALVFEGKETKVYDPASDRFGPYVVEPPAGEGVGHFSEQLPEDQLLEFLRTAEIKGCTVGQDGVRFAKICDLEGNDLRLKALFQSVDEKPGEVAEEPRSVPRTYRNEIASFLIDRTMDIGLVPATVERSVEGVPGSLQIWLDAAVDEALIEIYGKTKFLDNKLVDLLSQAEAVMAFMDIHEAHSSIGLMYLPHEERFQIADVTKAFSTSTELNPELMSPPCPPISAKRRLELIGVSFQEIETAAGRYLSDEQIKALLVRRDLILERCPATSQESNAAD